MVTVPSKEAAWGEERAQALPSELQWLWDLGFTLPSLSILIYKIGSAACFQ